MFNTKTNGRLTLITSYIFLTIATYAPYLPVAATVAGCAVGVLGGANALADAIKRGREDKNG